nr:methylmalonyl-CoA mutase family protein [Thalassobacillus sp. C254]
MNQEDVKKTMEQICDFPIPATVSWKETAEKSLKGASYERKLLTQTYEGITIHPLYRKEDIAGLPFINVMPGQFPYTRGTSTSLPVKTPWEISQEIRESTPERFHCALKHDIQRGQNSLVIMLDQNVKLGIDPFDGKEAAGKEGLSICNAEDVKTALQSIEAADVPFHVETGEHPLPVFSLFLAALDGSVKELKGSIAADPFGAWVIKGELTYELEKIFNGMAEIVRWCQEQECPVKTILVSTSPYHNGGASAVEELAYALATAVTYIEELKERKIPPEEAAKRIRFQFSIGSDYFLEIAKLRAARSLWANVMAAIQRTKRQGR